MVIKAIMVKRETRSCPDGSEIRNPNLAGPKPNRAEGTAKYAETQQEQVFFPCVPRIPGSQIEAILRAILEG